MTTNLAPKISGMCLYSQHQNQFSMRFSKNWLTPARACSWMGVNLPSHITYNPSLTRLNGADYDIVRDMEHDGSGNFTKELLLRSMGSLVKKRSYDNRKSLDGVVDVKYEIGTIRNARVYKDLMMRERIRIPVKCTLIYPETN